MVNVLLENVNYPITATGLKSKRKYRLQMVCQSSQDQQQSAIVLYNFTTLDNGGSSIKIRLDFIDNLPTSDQQQELSCLLAIYFKVAFP